MMTRTQDEILARITELDSGNDFFGFAREVLVDALDFEHAKPFLKPEITEDQWPTSDFDMEAREYLKFAIGKIRDHRGISASRSVDKLAQFAWLLGRDDVVDAMGRADYPQYGAPKVKVFADGMGFPWPDDADLTRMAQGLSCDPEGCDAGCGA